MQKPKPRVAIQKLADGSERYWVEGGVDVFIVTEQSSDDRVFRLGQRSKVGRDYIDRLLGHSRIGFTGDGSPADELAELFVGAEVSKDPTRRLKFRVIRTGSRDVVQSQGCCVFKDFFMPCAKNIAGDREGTSTT